MQNRYLDSIRYQSIVETVSNHVNKKYPHVHNSVPLLECMECILTEMWKCKYCRKYPSERKRTIFINLFDDITTMLTDTQLRNSFCQYSEDLLIGPMYDLLTIKKPQRRRMCCF